MNFDFSDIIYLIITAIIGFFLRDLYAYIKKKLTKAEKPRISIDYSYKYYSATGENPRKYKFQSTLIIHNIDIIPIYDVDIFKYINDDLNNTFLTKVSLRPDEKIEKKDEVIIEYGDGYNHPEEAEKLLPDIFSNPTIQVHYKNKDGKKFKLVWQKNNQ